MLVIHSNILGCVFVCMWVEGGALLSKPEPTAGFCLSCACLLVCGLQQREQKKRARAVPVYPILRLTRSVVVLERQTASLNLKS